MEEIIVEVVPNKEELKKRLAIIQKENEPVLQDVEGPAPAGSIDEQLAMVTILGSLFAILLLVEKLKQIRANARSAKQKIIDGVQGLANEVSKSRKTKFGVDRSKGKFGATIDDPGIGASVDVGGG